MRGGREEREREGGLNSFKPLESARDNYTVQTKVRHRTQKRREEDDGQERGAGKTRLQERGEQKEIAQVCCSAENCLYIV